MDAKPKYLVKMCDLIKDTMLTLTEGIFLKEYKDLPQTKVFK